MWVVSDHIFLIRTKLNNVILHEAKTVTFNKMSACVFITVELRVSIFKRYLARFKHDIMKTLVEMSILPEISSISHLVNLSHVDSPTRMMDKWWWIQSHSEAELKISEMGPHERRPVSVHKNLQTLQQMLISDDFNNDWNKPLSNEAYPWEDYLLPHILYLQETPHILVPFTSNKSCFDFLRLSHSSASKSAV